MSENLNLAFNEGHELFLALLDDVSLFNAAFDAGQFTDLCLRNMASIFYYEEGLLYVQYSWMGRTTEIEGRSMVALPPYFGLVRDTLLAAGIGPTNRVRFHCIGLSVIHIDSYKARPKADSKQMLDMNTYNRAIIEAFGMYPLQTSSVIGTVIIKSSTWNLGNKIVSLEHVSAKNNDKISTYYLSVGDNTWEVLQEQNLPKVIATLLAQ